MEKNQEKKNKVFKIHVKNRKFGIVAESYNEIMSKCKKKFKMNEAITLKLEDGTEVDEDYFEILSDNTELFIGTEGTEANISSKILARLEDFLLSCTARHQDISGQLENVLKNKNISKMLLDLSSLDINTSKHHLSSRIDDPQWFQGIHTKYSTKEEVLRNSAESRMRGYLHKFKKDLECCLEMPSFKMLIDLIQQKLKTQRYNGAYFDRSASAEKRLCDDLGLFQCDGDFERDGCPNSHFINPYFSREDRIIFSTWNFDHMIEKSRTIIPAAKEVLQESPETLNLNSDYLFDLLFGHYSVSKRKGNLKLVHVVCHNKNPHSLKCDYDKLRVFPNSPHKNKRRKLANNWVSWVKVRAYHLCLLHFKVTNIPVPLV